MLTLPSPCLDGLFSQSQLLDGSSGSPPRSPGRVPLELDQRHNPVDTITDETTISTDCGQTAPRVSCRTALVSAQPGTVRHGNHTAVALVAVAYVRLPARSIAAAVWLTPNRPSGLSQGQRIGPSCHSLHMPALRADRAGYPRAITALFWLRRPTTVAGYRFRLPPARA